ncbi:hypothetical protein Ancab_012740, partial [Ancistrocladus abbreviatus]
MKTDREVVLSMAEKKELKEKIEVSVIPLESRTWSEVVMGNKEGVQLYYVPMESSIAHIIEEDIEKELR